MAKVGDVITTPEAGWKRYLARTSIIQYDSSWSLNAGVDMISSVPGAVTKFHFMGTKLRILVYSWGNRSDMTISIDGGAPVTFKGNAGVSAENTLAYEITGLQAGRHSVEIKNAATTNSTYATLQSIDIDDSGRLLHPTEVTSLRDLEVGKSIRTRYRSSLGMPGRMSKIGQEEYIDGVAEFIPTTTAGPTTYTDGHIYLVASHSKNGELILVSDRLAGTAIGTNFTSEGILSKTGAPMKEEITILSVQGSSPLYNPQLMYDNDFTTSFGYFQANTATKWELYFTLEEGKVIDSFKLRSYYSAGYDAVGKFNVYGSNTSHQEGRVLLGTFQHANISDAREYLIEENNESYKFITLEILDSSMSNGGNEITIWDIAFFAKNDEYSMTLRMLAGSPIQDSEFDNYVVRNPYFTMVSKYVWEWTNSMSTTVNSLIVRGSTTGNGATYADPTSTQGFRPVVMLREKILFPSVSLDRDSYLVARGEGTKMNITVSPDATYPDVEWGVRATVGTTRIFWSGYVSGPQNFSVRIPPRLFLDTGDVPILVELLYDGGTIRTLRATAKIVNEKPEIRLVRDGYKLEIDIVDADGDPMYYEIKLNGFDLVPGSQAMGSMRMDYYLTSSMLNIGGQNTVKVNVTDIYGDKAEKELTFIGEYQGLIFTTPEGDFYSVDGGTILKRLVMNPIYAGDESAAYPVVIKNQYPFNVRELKLTIQYYEPIADSDVFISSNMALVDEKVIQYDDMLSPKQGKTFYVQLKTGKGAVGKGKFRVSVSARKV